jgi:hypothetical protein
MKLVLQMRLENENGIVQEICSDLLPLQGEIKETEAALEAIQDYSRVIRDALNIFLERSKSYGFQTWRFQEFPLQVAILQNALTIYSKSKRVINIISQAKSDFSQEASLDSALDNSLDAINYSIFTSILCKNLIYEHIDEQD